MVQSAIPTGGRFRRITRKAGLLVVMALMLACNLIGNTPDQAQTIISGPPAVRLSAPLPNATYLEKVGVNVQALVSNAGADIDRVEVSVDNAVVASLPQPNQAGAPSFTVTQTWQAEGVGPHTISVTAFRADGSSSSPATVTINVVADASLQKPTNTPSPTTAPTEEPTEEAQETEEPPEDQGGGEQAAQENPDEGDNGGGDNQSDENSGDNDEGDEDNTPRVTFNVGVNVRRGPGTNFEPPISSYRQDDEAQILAINPGGDWYKISGVNGQGWVAASLVTVSGDTSNIDVDPGPPTPVPATPTPVATATPQTSVNLVVDGFDLEGYPDEIFCGNTFDVTVRVKNTGSTRSPGGYVGIKDTGVRDGGAGGQTEGTFPELDPGQSYESKMRLTVSTYVNEQHRIIATVDSKGQIAETNENDNARELQYKLGDCDEEEEE